MSETIARTPLQFFEFIGMEEQQLLTSMANNREELALLARMESLYCAAMSCKTVKENDFIVFQLLTFTHYHFLFSTACKMRCHLSEAFASARAAIDAALIAAQIIHDRGSQVAYVKHDKPFDNFARYLGNLIKDGKDFPHPLASTLFNQHKQISRFASHADVDSFVHRVKKTTIGGEVVMSVEYFQFARNDTERKIHALTLSHTFVMVMDVFSDFLVTEQKVVSPEWQSELHAIGKLIEHRALELQAELPKDEQVKEA